jgi:hypothetical protein
VVGDVGVASTRASSFDIVEASFNQVGDTQDAVQLAALDNGKVTLTARGDRGHGNAHPVVGLACRNS